MRFKTLRLGGSLGAGRHGGWHGIQAQAETEIQWWHSMGGALNGEWVNDLAKDFNSQAEGLQDRARPSRAATPNR